MARGVDLSGLAQPRAQRSTAAGPRARVRGLQLFRTEVLRARKLGFEPRFTYEEEQTMNLLDAHPTSEFVAVLDLVPVTNRTRAIVRGRYKADAIRGEQRFREISHAAMALGDAFRVALDRAAEVM